MRLAHTSSVAISLIINGVLILALFTFITLGTDIGPETTTVMVIDPTDQEDIEDIEEEIELEEIVDPSELDDLTDMSMEMELETDFEPETEEIQENTETDLSSLTELMTDVSSPVVMKGLMVGRTPKSRAAAVKRYGNGLGRFTEPAVMKALRWLKDNQESNGSWAKDGSGGGQANVGYTGLALLTYLAHGETPSSAEFGESVGRGIRYLIENQNSDGTFQDSGRHQGYGHAMAVYALAEAYTMTKNPLLREPIERGLDVMIEGQMTTGGYDYDYKNADRNDISLGAWHVQAMKAAVISGVGGNRLKEYFQKAMDGVMQGAVKRSDGNGINFAYTVDPNGTASGLRRIVSAAGTLCLFLSGRGDTAEAAAAIDFLETYTEEPLLPEWDAERPDSGYGGTINEWYYAVQAFFQEDPDGNNFRRYMPAMVKALTQNQAEDGHWLCYTKSGQNQGKTYNTTLGALGLMVFYRYLPTTQADNIRAAEPAIQPPQEAEDEIGFEI